MIKVIIPTRSRPDRYLKSIDALIKNADSLDDVSVNVVLDSDDPRINEYQRLQRANITYNIGGSISKIHAVNRMAHVVEPTDLLVLLSDDMVCVRAGWDNVLRDEVQSHGLDKVFYFSDGYTYPRLNTMPIMGGQYLKRFGYIYHPSYASLWADNEFTDVSRELNAEIKSDTVLFVHEHPLNTPDVNMDDLYAVNDKSDSKDRLNYIDRRRIRNADRLGATPPSYGLPV